MRCSTGTCALLVAAALLAGGCASAPPREAQRPAPAPPLDPVDAADPAGGEGAEVVVAPAPPVLAEPGELTVAEGEDVSSQIDATDPNDDPLTFSATGLPPGLVLDPTGLLSGAAAAGTRGSYSALVTVDDGSAVDEVTVPLTVTPSTATGGPDDVRFAVIGGAGPETSPAITELITGWDVDFVAGTGNLNPTGDPLTIDLNIGRHYSQYLAPYTGAFGEGSTDGNRFWPAMGDDDWLTTTCEAGACVGPHLDYFELPGNERYYDVREGPVHLFVLDSNASEPDGRDERSVQAEWLRTQLEASDATWKVVLVNAPGWSSATGTGSEEALRWPFAAWGADAVLAGRDNAYERLTVDGIPHVVNGTGGAEADDFGPELAVSEVRDASSVGVTRVLADTSSITFQFVALDGTVVDSFTRSAADRNSPPWFGRLIDRFGVSGQVIALPVTADDLDGDELEYSAQDLPTGLTLDPSTGLITGSIAAPEPSRWAVEVTASDGIGSDTATFVWYVGFSAGDTVSARPVDGGDDAEEAPDGTVSIVSTDLELVRDETEDQVVGIRFPGVAVPAGSRILDAYIELVADELSAGPTSLTIRVQDADDAPVFTDAALGVSGRPLAPAAVGWTVGEPWENVGESHRTPDLSALVEAVVTRPGWQQGNAIVFVIRGSGGRTASSVDRGAGREPKLVVTYTTGEA